MLEVVRNGQKRHLSATRTQASGLASGNGTRPGWTGAVLIRPDGVIAWKPAGPARETAGQLTGVLAGLLSAGVPAP